MQDLHILTLTMQSMFRVQSHLQKDKEADGREFTVLDAVVNGEMERFADKVCDLLFL